MIRSVKLFFVAVLLVAGAFSDALRAQIPVTWDGGNGRWESANWTKEGVSGLTASAAMGDNTGGRGGLAISIGGGAMVEYDPNPSTWAGLATSSLAWMRGREAASPLRKAPCCPWIRIAMPDGRWMRVGLDITLDDGTLRRTHSGSSVSGGRIIYGYRNELLPNQKVNINVINGGRIENDAKMVFGDPALPPTEGHSPGIEVAMTINNGTLDLTGGADFQEFFGLADGELVFFYEYEQGVGPKNEKYSINFTGPGTIIIDNGIFVAEEDADGNFAPAIGTDLDDSDHLPGSLGTWHSPGQWPKRDRQVPISAPFLRTTGTVGEDNYTLTSLLAAAGVAGDYNDNGVVDAADYVLWRNGGPLENEVEDPGTTSPADYNAWRARFGNGSAGGAALLSANAAVPEPATLACLLIAIAGLLLRGRIR